MENYDKGEVQELEDNFSLTMPESTLRMRVNSGSKIKNLMSFAMNKLQEANVRQVAWTGCGEAVTKAISCAEIMKRRIKGLHQLTDVRYKKVIEYWLPKKPELDRLQVTRDIPAVTVLLSKDPIDTAHPSYQSPELTDVYWMSEAPPPVVTRREQQHVRPPRTAGNALTASLAEVPFTGKHRGKRKGGDTVGRGGMAQGTPHKAKGRPAQGQGQVQGQRGGEGQGQRDGEGQGQRSGEGQRLSYEGQGQRGGQGRGQRSGRQQQQPNTGTDIEAP